MKEIPRRMVSAATRLLRLQGLWRVRPRERSATAEIMGAEDFPGGVRINCQFTGALHDPLAPAGLYSDPNSAREVLELHRVYSRRGDTVIFESFGITSETVPPTGQVFHYRAWWIPAAMEAALDRNAAWQHRKYPDDGNHDHCLFTWETIAAYAETRTGYWSRKHGWITERAYEDFIRDDVYRLRSR